MVTRSGGSAIVTRYSFDMSDSKHKASATDLVICGVLMVLVILMGAMTAVRLGHVPSELLQPLLTVEPVAAQTWNARAGRMYTCGANCFVCEQGYGEAVYHHTISNTWNSVWSVCVAGPW